MVKRREIPKKEESGKVFIIIPTHSRRKMFYDVLEDLKKTKIPSDLVRNISVLVAADAPTFSILKASLPKFGKANHLTQSRIRKGCDRNILFAMEKAVLLGAQWVINIEDDSQLNPRWLEILWEIKEVVSAGAYGVYNSRKHPTSGYVPRPDYQICHKATAGGFGLMISKPVIQEFSAYSRKDIKEVSSGWDWLLCRMLREKGYRPPFAITTPSFIQHVGVLGTHTNGKHDSSWDYAEDFVGRARK